MPTSSKTQRSCAIGRCPSPKNVHYFCFPQKDAKLLRLWISKCKRTDKVNVNNARVCEQHFSVDDFQRNLQDELLNRVSRKKLKPGAYPNLKIPGEVPAPTEKEDSARSLRLKEKERKLFVEEILLQARQNAQSDLKQSPLGDQSRSKEKGIQCSDDSHTKRLEKKIKKLQSELAQKNNMISHLQGKVRYLSSQRHIQRVLRESLEKNHSKTQVSRILNPSTSYNRGYSKEDITTALILRSISPKAFEFLRQKKMFALPSVNTLKKFLEDYTCEPGYLVESLTNLSEKLMTPSLAHENLAVLCFDEMEVLKTYEFSFKREQIFGPFRKMLMVLVRGLFVPWEMPIFLQFDSPMNKELLFEIIERVERNGVIVKGITFDMDNRKIISDLKLSPDSVSFENPADPSRLVYAFPDCPNLLKSFRNHLLDDGYEFQVNGAPENLTKKDLEDLLDQRDKGTLFKVSKEKHLECSKAERHNVLIAAELLSNSVAKSFLEVYGGEKMAQSRIIETVNNWFDSMNSSSTEGHTKLSSGFGIHLEEQLQSINEMEKLTQGMKVKGKSSSFPFINGILISIRSMRALIQGVQNDGIISILTSRLNNDALDKLFSRIRVVTGNKDCPSPVDILRKVKILVAEKTHELSLINPLVDEEMEDLMDDSQKEAPEVTVIIPRELVPKQGAFDGLKF